MSPPTAGKQPVSGFAEIIAIKRDGGELSREQVARFVRGASDGSIGDEQLAAMLMALCIRGASPAETLALVEEMRDSGARWELRDRFPVLLDKHSTGGVGDSVSLVLAPLVAACSIPVAMMAGAGLGHTQGTLDKLAAIPGFAVARSRGEALRRLETCGVCFAAQSAEIAPADRKLYALRDVTATVPSLPLIVASIMSKKLALGAAALVLDVKMGSGAFCKNSRQAWELAEALVGVARAAGMPCRALVTEMNQPLGRHLGCASEVRAALEVLENRGSARLKEVTLALAAAGMALVGHDEQHARRELERALEEGRARREWDRMVAAHGGDPDPLRLLRPRQSVEVAAGRAGWVIAVDAESLGWVAVALGAGRRFAGDTVDPGAGLVVHARLGDAVEVGQPLATLELGVRQVNVEALAARTAAAFTVGETPPAVAPLIVASVGGE